MPTVALTGASGYLGACLARRFRANGWLVRPLTRHASDMPDGVPFRLGEPVRPEVLQGALALVHCAYDFSITRVDEIFRVNVSGTDKLFRAAREAGVPRLVCVSSISAYDGCKSHYGKAKLGIEAIAHSFGALVVRPGLIWGEAPGGMLGKLMHQVRTSRIVPLIGSGSQVQYLVHENDLAGVIVGFCLGNQFPTQETVTVAHPRAWPFRELLRCIAHGEGADPIFIPFPWRLVWGALRIAELLGIPLAFRSDSVVSLMNQNPSPDFSVAQRLGVVCRPFP